MIYAIKCTHCSASCSVFTLLAVLIQQADAKQTIDCAQFMSWLSVEPQSIVWLPTLHRLAASEAGKSPEFTD